MYVFKSVIDRKTFQILFLDYIPVGTYLRVGYKG